MKRFREKAGDALVAIALGGAVLVLGLVRLIASPFPWGSKS